MRKEIEDRLIRFSGDVYRLSNNLDSTFASIHLSKQIIRSSTSVALNYGESQAAESKRDFIHKYRLILKELRESHINLQIMKEIGVCKKIKELEYLLDEGNQLISIFYVAIKTARMSK